MILSWCVYSILIALLIWGGKFAGFKSQFNDDFMSLTITKSLRGYAALGVLIHHIAQVEAFRIGRELTLFPNIGFLFVGLFFFCSGYGLYTSYISKQNYLQTFFKQRLLSLIIPFYVMNILYAAYYVCAGWHMPVEQWILSFIGITMMNSSAWYVIVLFILYLVFYFSFKNISNLQKRFWIILATILFMSGCFILIGHFAWWAGEPNWWMSESGWKNAQWWMGKHITWFHGEWWVNSSITFLVGMIFAANKKNVIAWFKRAYWLKFVAVLLLAIVAQSLSNFCCIHFGFWSEFSGTGPGFANKAICLIFQQLYVTLFAILIFTAMMKYHAKNPVSTWLGEISLETYLMQYMVIFALEFMVFSRQSETPIIHQSHTYLGIYMALAIGITILLAIVFKWINTKILTILHKKR